jgi:hypothetical protein
VTYPQQPEQYPGPGGTPTPGPGGMPAPGTGPEGMAAPWTGGMPAPGTGPGGPPAQPASMGFGQMPAYPAGAGYGAPPRQKPSGGTAITAGVLAIVGAVWALGSAVINWMQVIVMAIEVLTLTPGAIMLFRRMSLGRWLILVGCVLHILQGAVAIAVIDTSGVLTSTGNNPAVVGGTVVGGLIVLLPAIATLVLVLVPLTARWCAWRPTASLPTPPPGYGQPPQQW